MTHLDQSREFDLTLGGKPGFTDAVTLPRALCLMAVALGAVLPMSQADAGTTGDVVARYTFDSLNGGTVYDSSGYGHNLTLSGTYSVAAGVSSPAVRFEPVSLANSPNRDDLNPLWKEFAVTVVFRLPTDVSGVPDSPNIAQKGYYGDAGQWKMQLKPSTGAIQCRLKGSTGSTLLTSSVTGVTDGRWHTATCWRDSPTVGVTVDGIATTENVSVGNIGNSRPLRIGAKSLTAATDQFTGVIDYVSMASGPDSYNLSRQGI